MYNYVKHMRKCYLPDLIPKRGNTVGLENSYRKMTFTVHFLVKCIKYLVLKKSLNTLGEFFRPIFFSLIKVCKIRSESQMERKNKQ